MTWQEFEKKALELPWKERLQLAQALLASLHERPSPEQLAQTHEGSPKIETTSEDDWPNTSLEESVISVSLTSRSISIPNPPALPERTLPADSSENLARSFRRLRDALGKRQSQKERPLEP